MNIAIIGFGKMGKMIHMNAIEKGHYVVSIIDSYSTDPLVSANKLSIETLNNADVAIDFSHPSCIIDNIKFYIQNNIPAVIGTTGWYDKLEELKLLAKDYPQSSIIYSGNFSIGVSLYREVVKMASKLFGTNGSYDVFVNEIHHREKADSPSGTASMIADVIKDNFDGKNKIVTERLDHKIDKQEFHVSSTRGGWVPGTHSVTFDSPFDSVELIHRARTREGFARGAVLASMWIEDKKGFFTLDDFVDTLINNK
ncbi:MAG: 4-hydroxy-tetrahydrodipicolinate reductase [Spirochaetaceae bacterium]|nr:4-hydroxy-tetrahydrodipicolinate reductase [Spirochaetaceae bacterium]